MSGSGLVALSDVHEALQDVWERLRDSPGCPGANGRPSRMSGSGREDCPMSRSGRESLPDVRGACRMSGNGRETLPDLREWSKGYT